MTYENIKYVCRPKGEFKTLRRSHGRQALLDTAIDANADTQLTQDQMSTKMDECAGAFFNALQQSAGLAPAIIPAHGGRASVATPPKVCNNGAKAIPETANPEEDDFQLSRPAASTQVAASAEAAPGQGNL